MWCTVCISYLESYHHLFFSSPIEYRHELQFGECTRSTASLYNSILLSVTCAPDSRQSLVNKYSLPVLRGLNTELFY